MIVKRDYSNIPLPHIKKAAPSAALMSYRYAIRMYILRR